MKGPDSKCFCPNGLFLCSHTMGFLMLLAYIQRNTCNISMFTDHVLVPNVRALIHSHSSSNILAHVVNEARKEKNKVLKEEVK